MIFQNKNIKYGNLQGVIISNPDIPQAKSIWDAAASETNNVFLSWVWIGPWLTIVRERFDVNLFVVYKNDKVIAAVFILLKHDQRHIFVKSRQIFINEIHADKLNMIIEYNGIAVHPNDENDVMLLFCKWLSSENAWDELVLSAIERTKFSQLQQALSLDCEILDQGMSRQTILSANTYESSDNLKKSILSSNKRSQINRAKKYIENLHGTIELEIANSVDQALQYFDDLGILHTKYWQKKGLPGSFANDNWTQFNKNLIESNFENNHIQLIKIKAGDFTIGYLYNLTFKQRVFNVQSGFQYLDDNKYKPGFLSHWLAIEHCWQHGYELYDFLAGGEDYKKSFSNAEVDLVWAKLIRPKFSFFIEKNLKKLLRFYRHLLKR